MSEQLLHIFRRRSTETTSSPPHILFWRTAKAAAEKAAALDGNLDQAHASLAGLAWFDWNWTRGEKELREAIKLNPNSASVRWGYSYLLLVLKRRAESDEQARVASLLDPLSPRTLVGEVARLYYGRQYAEGAAPAKASLELQPQDSYLRVYLANIYVMQGEERLAADEILTTEQSMEASSERMTALESANRVSGLQALRRKRIELNKRTIGPHFENAYDIAVDCSALGQKEQALVWLERAVQSHDPKIGLIAIDPLFDTLRSDARFGQILRRVGLSS